MRIGQQFENCPDCGYSFDDPDNRIPTASFTVDARSHPQLDSYVCHKCGCRIHVFHDKAQYMKKETTPT